MHSRFSSRFGTIIALLISLNAHAAITGGAEVVLFTPWTFIQKNITAALSSRSINDNQTLPALDWQLTPWTPHLTNVKWDYKSKVDMVSFTPQAVQLKTKQLAVTITIEKFSIDQIIEREIDGAILRVHVQAECGPVVMSQATAQMEARLGFQIQPQKVETSLDMFTLTWAPGSWQVSDFQCQGPGGFDQSIKAELVQDLKSAEMVRPWLQAMIAQRAQAEADSLMTQLANPIPTQLDKGSLVLSFQRMQNAPEGILNYATLVWSGKTGETNLTPLIMDGVPAASAKSAQPLFITPADGWTNLIAAQLQLRGDTFAVNMNQIKSFQDLLNSPMQQWSVWPDLQNYTPKSKFTLQIARPRAYALAWRTDGTADVQSPVSAVIQSVRAGKGWNYIDLTGAVAGRLRPSISAGKLNAAIKFSSSNFNAKFEPAYTKAFQPDTKLDPQVLQAFSTYVNQGFNYSSVLPVLDLGIAGKATFAGWTGISKVLIGLPLNLKSPAVPD